MLRGCVSAFSGGNAALWAGVLGEQENLYARGAYFYIYVAMYYAAMLYLMVATVRTAAAFQNRSRTLIYPLTLFLGAETVIQLALPELHVTWLCVTLLSVLYYIYCSEMWNQLDALTGLLNQNSYLNRTAEMRRSGGCWWCLMWMTSSRSTTATAICRRCLPCRDRGLHQKSLCPLRLLLPHRRR